MPHPLSVRRPAPVVLALMALMTGACAESPSSPTAPSAVLTIGSVPQAGVPPAAPLPGPTALGATRFMAFGDSITCGTISSFDGTMLLVPENCRTPPSYSYPSQLDDALEAGYPSQNFTVDNEGSPGEWAAQAVSSGRFGAAMAAARPQGLLLLEGINDLNNAVSISATVNALSQMIDIARVYNATVLVATMFQTCLSVSPEGVVRQNSADKIVAFNSAIRSMAAGRQNVYVVDLYAAFGDNCGQNGGVGLLGGDGLHPTANGYSVMASTFRNVLRTVFQVRGSFE